MTEQQSVTARVMHSAYAARCNDTQVCILYNPLRFKTFPLLDPCLQVLEPARRLCCIARFFVLSSTSWKCVKSFTLRLECAGFTRHPFSCVGSLFTQVFVLVYRAGGSSSPRYFVHVYKACAASSPRYFVHVYMACGSSSSSYFCS